LIGSLADCASAGVAAAMLQSALVPNKIFRM
jgi:hypothetical protein